MAEASIEPKDCETSRQTLNGSRIGRYVTRNEYYDMNNKYRGKAIIFNHETYEPYLKLKPRPGTNTDCDNLEKALTDLGFCVDVFHNLCYVDIMKYTKQAAKSNHSKNDCFLMFVLTHGMSGILYAKDTFYRSEKLWCHFTENNCPTLAGKPKLFLIQACQGEKVDDGITLAKDVETDGWFEPHKYPTQPDFLVVLSSVPGYFSWRNSVFGCWFVQALCEELYSATDTDFLVLLTNVCQKVALNFKSSTDDPEMSKKRQVPCFTSMLTRRLIFTKKPINSMSLKSSFLQRFKDCATTSR